MARKQTHGLPIPDEPEAKTSSEFIVSREHEHTLVPGLLRSCLYFYMFLVPGLLRSWLYFLHILVPGLLKSWLYFDCDHNVC